MSDNKETTDRVIGAIHDFAAMKPEDGETWESWYAAAFDLLGDKVGDLLSAAATERVEKQAPAVEADERELDAHLIDRMSKLLAEIALVLNSDPAPLTRPSYHDLPNKVRALQCEVELQRAINTPAVETGARDEREAFEAWLPSIDSRPNFSRHIVDGYDDWDVERAWAGWKARASDDEFKNFHRLLCERFDYTHDEKDWKRDQLSLIEWIANRASEAAEVPAGYNLVPVEPTVEMLNAALPGDYSFGFGFKSRIYKEMISAAPMQKEHNKC